MLLEDTFLCQSFFFILILSSFADLLLLAFIVLQGLLILTLNVNISVVNELPIFVR